jgi:hypothetical protein
MDRVSQDNRALTIRPHGQTRPSASLMSGIDDKLAERVMAAGMKQGPVYSQTQMWAQLGTAAIGGIFKGMAAEKKGEILQRLSASMEGANIDPQDKREIDGLLKAGYVSLAVNKSDQAKRLKAATKERLTLKAERRAEAKRLKAERGAEAKSLRTERREEARNLKAQRFEEAQRRREFDIDQEKIKYARERRHKLADARNNLRLEDLKKHALDIVKKAKSVKDGEDNLRTEYNREQKSAKIRFEAYASIENSRKLDTATGDFAMIKLLNTILEPSGRVSDAEFTAAAQAGNITEQAKFWIRKMGNQKGRLTHDQRDEILDTAKAVVSGTVTVSDSLRTWYLGIISRHGYNPLNVLTPQGRPGNPVGTMTPEDRARLAALQAEKDRAEGRVE